MPVILRSDCHTPPLYRHPLNLSSATELRGDNRKRPDRQLLWSLFYKKAQLAKKTGLQVLAGVEQ